MKALILVGGFGTRLRPLTLTLPKPLVEFCNKAMILHQIDALVKAGVKDIVLAVNYRPEVMVAMLKQTEEEYGITITFSVETEPLGTAGPLALAREILGKDDSPFFVLNSDVTCTYPFEAFRDFHAQHGCEGSIMVTKVAEPSAYGVVVTKPGSTIIDRFVEKPVEFVGNRINAGIYIFNPSVLDRIELRPTSIEKEIFPAVAADHQLHSFDLQGFWMDVGQPKDYLSGTCLYLSHLTATHSPLLTDPKQNKWVHGGNVLADPTAEIDPTALIGPNVVIGPGAKIGPGVRLQRCVIMANATVRDHAWIQSSIIGWNSTVGRWTRVENITVLGDDVSIKDELYVNGASVLPHKSISTSITEPRIVMFDFSAPSFLACGKTSTSSTAISEPLHPKMSSNGMVSAITSTLRRDKKPQHHANAEDERLLRPSTKASSSREGETTGYQVGYGSTADREAEPDVQARDYAGDKGRLDGNDVEVWQSVEGRGLDGRGSIRSARSYSDRASSIEHARRRHQLTKASYTYLKVMYLLVPAFTLLGSWALVMLAVYAWPPTSDERRLPPSERPQYPHPFLWPPLLIGILASVSMQALRDPVLEAVKLVPEQLAGMFGGQRTSRERSRNTAWLLFLAGLGIFFHTVLQEALRIIALCLCEPHQSAMVTTTQLFQQSYYLGIGWGLAEAFWGITRGWFSGVRLWSDLLEKPIAKRESDEERNLSTSTARDYATATSQQLDSEVMVADDQSSVSSLEDEEDNLLAKIEALQRLRGRKDLEDALGKPFPNIAVAVHILWRLDTILLNLGFTLVVSAFYYNTEPIYHRLSARTSLPSGHGHGLTRLDQLKPHKLFPLVVAGVFVAHFIISWIWAVAVRRVGLSAVTWGSLVISLATFFAGLGSWGGLV